MRVSPAGVLDALRREAVVPHAGLPLRQRRSARLGLVSYGLVLGLAVEVVVSRVLDLEPPIGLYALPMVVLMVLQVTRAAVARAVWPERRPAVTVLLVSAAMFVALGIVSGNLPPQHGFPNITEILFVPPHIVLAAFVVLDMPGRQRITPAAVLEAVVIGGGAACLSALTMVSPLARAFPGMSGPSLLLLLIQPLIAAALIILVLAGLVLGRRAWGVQTVALLAGLAVLGVATSQLLRASSQPDNLVFGPDFALYWSASLTLIVSGGCGPRLVPRETGRATGAAAATIGAASVAVGVLDLTQEGYLAVLSTATIAAAGARLALAFREAHGAAEAHRLSQTDELTGLPNRRAVVARAEAADDDDEPIALLLADLDGFKQVNDTLGHHAGDSVLRVLARRLQGALPAAALLSRLGGDEFAIVLPVAGGPSAAEVEAAALAQADHVREVLGRPVEVLGHSVTMDASIGIAVRARNTDDGPDLLRRADIAMYQAKDQHCGVLIYHPDRDEFTPDRLRTAEYLRRGIPAGQLVVWYQPQVDATTHALTGVEALVRWNHPELGTLAPGQFLGVARQAGLMPLLTEAVMDGVLADVVRLAAAGVHTRLSFNVAPAELLNAALMERLLSAVDRAALPEGTLVLEITEDSLLADPDRARAALESIVAHQVEVAIDDYGAGYSSLAYLRDLPVHELKLDRSFVVSIGTDHRTRIMVTSTGQMARGLGLRTVAEGVEDAATADELRRAGMDVLQGFHFARPMPFDQLLRWIAERPAAIAAAAAPAAPAASGPPDAVLAPAAVAALPGPRNTGAHERAETARDALRDVGGEAGPRGAGAR